jgi:hypothetical protein
MYGPDHHHNADALYPDHSWMYNGWDMDEKHSDEWLANTTSFVDLAVLLSKTVR